MTQLIRANELGQIGTTLFETRRGLLTLDEVRDWLNTGMIVRLFRTWAVTDYGVECMVEYYPIEARTLAATDWERQLRDKSWTTAAMMHDFCVALTFAKQYFGI